MSLHRPLRRSRAVSAFADSAEKQESRERVARIIAKYYSDGSPKVFVMPAHRAQCAKTIDKLVPNAVFYGADYLRSVVQKTDAVAPGKIIHMQKKSVANYIRDNAGLLSFDAAFLDYKTYYVEKRAEVKEFAAKMLKSPAILAITAQRHGSEDILDMMTQDLREVAAFALEDFLEYSTTNFMVNAIFRRF